MVWANCLAHREVGRGRRRSQTCPVHPTPGSNNEHDWKRHTVIRRCGTTGYPRSTTSTGPTPRPSSLAKTSEFYFAIIAIAGILIATYADSDDSLVLDEGWRMATFVAVAYIIQPRARQGWQP